MLINLRNALMTGKRLPYDAEVEYLESTGTQWIDTGVIFSADNGFSITYSPTNSDTYVNNGSIFGSRTTDGDTRMMVGFNAGNAATIGNGCKVYVGWGVLVIPATETHIAKIGSWYTATANISTATATDGIGTTALLSTLPTQTRTAYIFGANTQSGPLLCRSRIAACKIYQNGVLVRDYIPVRKGTVGYLYDRVSGKLFGNAGTGDFVLGQDVVPVEYIESHGTEYIDTGVIPTAADSFYCRIRQSVVADQCLWGLAGVAYCFSNWAGVGSSNGTYWGHPAIGTGGVQGVNPLGDTNWHEILCQPSGIFVDGVQINTQVTAPTQSPLNTVALFARSVNSAGGGVAKYGRGRMSAFKVERNGDPLRKYFPVRVGTEGALMDVLTRRIYRNAGTGAFGYGNDLKYPIPAE